MTKKKARLAAAGAAIMVPVIAVYLLLVSLNWYPYGGFAAFATSNAIASVIVELPDGEARASISSFCNAFATLSDCLRPTVEVPGECNPFSTREMRDARFQ